MESLFIIQLVDKYPDPRPHFNTLSTYVRALEEKEFLTHESLGATYRYFPIVPTEGYTVVNQLDMYSYTYYLNPREVVLICKFNL